MKVLGDWNFELVFGTADVVWGVRWLGVLLAFSGGVWRFASIV